MSAIFLRFFFLIFLCLLAAGCSGNSGELGMAGNRDIEMRNVCIGGYVLDVPARLKRQQKNIDSGGDATFYFGHDENFTKVDATVIDTEKEGAFESAVLAREAGLMQKRNFSADRSMFVSRESIRPNVELISSYASADSTDAIRLEVHTLLENAHVVLGETAYSAHARAGVQSRLIAMLSSLRSLGTTAAGSSSSGFCIGGVVFDLGNDYEEAEVAYAGNLDGIPVKLQLDVNTFEQASGEPTLIERGEANLEGLGIRPEKLRAGPRSLAGDAGDEWLGAFVDNGQRLHGFYAETRTQRPYRESPKLLASLSIGEEEAASPRAAMDDGVAIALWDRMLTSLRKRSD